MWEGRTGWGSRGSKGLVGKVRIGELKEGELEMGWEVKGEVRKVRGGKLGEGKESTRSQEKKEQVGKSGLGSGI